MLGMGLAGTLGAQQRIMPSDVPRLRQQNAREMVELQALMGASQREQKHVVKDASVVALEAKREAEANRMEKKGDQKANRDPRSPEEKAKVAALMKDVNAKLPEINASMKHALSNSTLPQIEIKPMSVEDVFSSTGANAGLGKTTEKQAIKQAIQKRLQEAMKQMDPQSRNQMKAVLKAAEEGKPIPRPQTLPPQQHSQLLPKGTL
jgi:hypothetical protein